VNRPLEAIALYREVLAQEPDNKEIADVLDDLIRRFLSPEEHIKSLEESVAQFPDDLEKKYDLALAYISVGQNQKALGLLETIHQREPANVRYLEALGNVQQNLSNFGAAIRAYSKILDLEPGNARIMVEISNCYRQLNDYPQARTYARRALAKDPGIGAAYVALAAIYETAADLKTQGKPPSYYDKLVFLVAYGLYLDAQQSGDYRVLDEASRHMRYLRESKLIPEYADWFMHQNDKDPTKGGGYDWINPDWPELRYIEKYLDEISRK
jgi:predicted Zn-dependent protease